jgi:hypothetical protein
MLNFINSLRKFQKTVIFVTKNFVFNLKTKNKAMKRFILSNKNALILCCGVLLAAAGIMSFQDSPAIYQSIRFQPDNYDTIPEKHDPGAMKMKDLDALSDNLDKIILQAGDELKKINLEDIQKTVENSLKNIDAGMIAKTVEESLKKIDLDKILESVKNSLTSVDWGKHKVEIDQALQEAKTEMENAKEEISGFDRKEIEKELEKARKEIEKSKLEIKKIHIDKILDEARAGIERAKSEVKETRAMFGEMEKDGLIHTTDGFTVEYRNRDLYINGKKQPENVTEKYRHYFRNEHFKMKIEKE